MNISIRCNFKYADHQYYKYLIYIMEEVIIGKIIKKFVIFKIKLDVFNCEPVETTNVLKK